MCSIQTTEPRLPASAIMMNLDERVAKSHQRCCCLVPLPLPHLHAHARDSSLVLSLHRLPCQFHSLTPTHIDRMKRTTIGLALVGAAAAAAVALLGNDSSRARGGGGGASDGSCTPTSSSSLLLLYHDDVHDIEGAERLLRDDFCPLFWLTDELLQHIVSFLQPGPDTSELFSVCVRFKDLMENDDTWHKLHARWFGSWKPEHTTWRMRCCYATLQLNTLLGRELFELWGSIQLGRAFADLDSAASSSSSSSSPALSSTLSSPTISSPPASLSTTTSSSTTTSTTTSPISSSAWWLRRRLAAPARSTRSRSFTTNSSSTPWVSSSSSSSSIAGLSNNRYTTMWHSIANSLPSWRSLWSYVASDLDLDFEDELDTYHDDADEGGSGSSGGASGSSASSYMSEPVDYGDPRYPASHSHKSDSGASELEWRVKRQWFWAARNGHEAMVHSLVSSHTVLDLDMREDETCMSALHVAAQYGQISVARELVALYHQRSLSVDPSCFGTTPLVRLLMPTPQSHESVLIGIGIGIGDCVRLCVCSIWRPRRDSLSSCRCCSSTRPISHARDTTVHRRSTSLHSTAARESRECC